MMNGIAKGFARRMKRLWRREDGTATVEFVIFVPVVLGIFMASVESGFYMVRHVMMERGLDLVMRDFRLGRLTTLNHNQIRNLVCDALPIVPNCRAELKVWIAPIDPVTWAVDTSMTYCGDRNGELRGPDTGTVVHGGQNEPMFVRICMIQQPLFPTTGIGLKLRADSVSGGYQLATSTVVVNEPT